MHEKTGTSSLIDRILDHPENKGKDKGELHELYEKIKDMTHKELQAEYHRLQ